jgi:hypothetical protein
MQSFSLTRTTNRWLCVCLLLGTSALALALPAPKDIEAAVNAGHLTQAETLLREVLQEKPNSARAHYELGEVLAREAKYDEALTEVQRAKTIDGSLRFATSPEKFQQTLDKISAAAHAAKAPIAAGAAPVVAPQSAPTAPSGPLLNLNYVLLGIGAIVLVAFLIWRSNAQAARSNPAYPAPMAAGPLAPTGFGAQYAPNAGGYGPGYAPGYGAPMQGGVGSGVGGAVLGGVAGLAAGYALTKALEGDHHSGDYPGAQGPSNRNRDSGDSGGYVPFDPPAQPDLGSFDAGSGDGWGGDGGSDGGGGGDW